MQEINYRGTDHVVRINGLDTGHWQEDVRVSVAGGADAIRIPKTQYGADVKAVEQAVEKAEREFGCPVGSTLLMAAIESTRGVWYCPELWIVWSY